MANSGNSTREKRGVRRTKWALVAIIVLLVLLISCTLAWFVQSLQVEDNVLKSTGDKQSDIYLLKQEVDATDTADSRDDWTNPGKDAATSSDKTSFDLPDGFQNTPTALTNIGNANPVRFLDPGDLTQAMDDSPAAQMSGVYSNTTSTTDNSFLPTRIIKKRLLVRNNSAVVPDDLDFVLSFDLGSYFKKDANGNYVINNGSLVPDNSSSLQYLAEAIRVDIYEVEKGQPLASDALPAQTYRALGAEELARITLQGTLEKAPTGENAVPYQKCYEFHFTFDPGASPIYGQEVEVSGGTMEQPKFAVNLVLDGFGGHGTTYFIRNEQDFLDALGYYEYKDADGKVVTDPTKAVTRAYKSGKLKSDGCTLVLMNDVNIGNYDVLVKYNFNLQTNGYDLVSAGTLEINTGAVETKWGTIDFGCNANKAYDDASPTPNLLRESYIQFNGKFYVAPTTSGGMFTLDANNNATGVRLFAPYTAVRWIAENNETAADPTLGGGSIPRLSTQPNTNYVTRKLNGGPSTYTPPVGP